MYMYVPCVHGVTIQCTYQQLAREIAKDSASELSHFQVTDF